MCINSLRIIAAVFLYNCTKPPALCAINFAQLPVSSLKMQPFTLVHGCSMKLVLLQNSLVSFAAVVFSCSITCTEY